MTSRPSQQCANGVECSADCCTPPRLWVISCSITVGCQSHGSGVARGGASIIAIRPPELEALAAPARVVVGYLGDAPDALVGGVAGRGIGEPVAEDEDVARVLGDALADGGGHGVEVLLVVGPDVRAAVAGQVHDLDVDVLRAAVGAHVEAQRAPAAGLQRQELLDARDVGLQGVLPQREAVRRVDGVGIDDLDLALAGREGGVCAVVVRGRRAAPLRRQVLRQVGGDRARQVRHRERAVDVRGREVGRRVAVVGLVVVAVGARSGREGQGQEQRKDEWPRDAHDPSVVGPSARDLHGRRTHDGAPDLHP